MSIIAITGGIGAGKSAACKQFAKLGVPIIDTDHISRQITDCHGAAIPSIRAAFGEHYITSDGAMDRAKMRNHVFNDLNARKQLEAITHPIIRQTVAEEIANNQRALAANALNIHYQIIAVPLLFESPHYLAFIDQAVVIDCEPALQVSRAMARSQLSEETVKAIMAAQISREKRLALADFVVENNKSLSALHKKINALHQELNQICHNH